MVVCVARARQDFGDGHRTGLATVCSMATALCSHRSRQPPLSVVHSFDWSVASGGAQPCEDTAPFVASSFGALGADAGAPDRHAYRLATPFTEPAE